jgi:uncharacterized protein YndB with AHSA1/START domain
MANPVTVTTPNDTEVHVVREFNARKELVFRAWTEAEFMKRWLTGFLGWEVTKLTSDPQPGGIYRIEWSGPDGAFMALTGTYREINPFDHMVCVEEFDEKWHPGESVSTLTFVEEEPGVTTVTMVIAYESKEARDIAVSTGMTDGMAYSYEALDAFLATQV